MKNLFYLLILAFQFSYGQTFNDSITSIQIKTFGANYKDFVVIEKDVFAITKGDSLIKINLNQDKAFLLMKNVGAIAKDSKKRLLFTKNDGSVFRFIKDGKSKKIAQILGKIFNILVDKHDKLIVISEKGVFYKNKYYLPEKNSSMFRKAGRIKANKTLISVDVLFLDHKERIWFGYDAGEWGGDVCFFDIKNTFFLEGESLDSFHYKKYETSLNDKDLIKLYPDKMKVLGRDTLAVFPHGFYISNIKGIAEDKNGNFYTAESNMHFFMSGSITKYSEIQENYYKYNEIKLLDYEKSPNQDIKNIGNLTEYLGPIQYNPFNDYVYYYTNKGFFKILQNKEIYSKEFIFKPIILWKFGLADAVGYQMNVKKFEFISENEMLFLTFSNGIGYYDGKILKYYQ